jgi:hypothetical protein
MTSVQLKRGFWGPSCGSQIRVGDAGAVPLVGRGSDGDVAGALQAATSARAMRRADLTGP